MNGDVFAELSLILAIATGVAFLVHLLRQPLIIGHIIAGVLIGPSLLDLVHSEDTVDVFAKIGITLLLFIIGLGLNPKVIKEVGKVSALTGVGQVVFTTLAGFGILNLLGYESTEALFIAIALTFSSTIIILKLLTDKKEQGRLYGKISIGFLLVQDIIATIALVAASTISDNSGSTSLTMLIINGLVLTSLLVLFSTRVLPHLSHFVANSQEFLFLFAIGWGLGISSLFAELGFSIEVGALFAGVALASTVYAQEVAAKLKPLRDFFIVLFFISLGAGLSVDSIGTVLPQGILLSLFVLIGNPLIVIFIMGLLGYTKKTSFKAGLTVAQISEFSLVFILLGREVGSVSEEVVSLITVVALITIAMSTYMITYADKLYDLLENYLRLFERRKLNNQEKEHAFRADAVIVGYKKGGEEFAKVFKSMKKKYLVVDYDPLVIDYMDSTSTPYIYGDAYDIDLLEEAGIEHAKVVVSAISDSAINLFLVDQLHKMNPNASLIMQANDAEEAKVLYDKGASYVMMPYLLGSEKIGAYIKRTGLRRSLFVKWREKHLKDLEKQIKETEKVIGSHAVEQLTDVF